MGRVRGKPKKQAATTPPIIVRVFSHHSSRGELNETMEIHVAESVIHPIFTPGPSENQSERLAPIVEEEKEIVEEETVEEKAEPKQPRVEIIPGNRLSSNGLEIEYFAHTIVDGEIEVIIKEILGDWINHVHLRKIFNYECVS